MTATRTIKTLAEEANGFLKRSADKQSDTTCTGMILPADDAPEWVNDLCQHAHGDFLPDDWRYEFIEDALSDLAAGDEDPRDMDSAYPYTRERLNWLASNLTRPGYCDEAAEEYGMKSGEVLTLIALGMGKEMQETFDLCRSFLSDRLGELEAAEEAE